MKFSPYIQSFFSSWTGTQISQKLCVICCNSVLCCSTILQVQITHIALLLKIALLFFRVGGTSYSFRNHIPTFWIFRRAGWGDLFYFLFSNFHCTNQVVIKQGLDQRETSFPKNIWTLEFVYAHIVIIGKLATAPMILKIYIYIYSNFSGVGQLE